MNAKFFVKAHYLPTILACTILAGCASSPDNAVNHSSSRQSPVFFDSVKAPQFSSTPYVRFEHEAWTQDAVIYQINTRQFSKEGTFNAVQQQLPRLKELGVEILWFMPIHPIGEMHRKGKLGSPYAVKDYFTVNPEFGTEEDFKALVQAAHAQGFKVILDWVANHTAWDNVVREAHPDWYSKNDEGQLHSTPWFDWDDIVELDYSQPDLRQYMTEAMLYWVREYDVDGYRADAAGFVPLDFWETATAELRKIKPVFMLAEWENRDLHAFAFDASYSWTWWDVMHDIAQGKKDVSALFGYYAWDVKYYPENAYRMLYVTNHDKNSWDGTEFEIFGDAVEAVTVLSFVSKGIPLIYNGQEAGNAKRLAFFERDPIHWQTHPHEKLLKALIDLKKKQPALWNGHFGGVVQQVKNTLPNQVLSFYRQVEGSKVLVVVNLSAQAVKVGFSSSSFAGRYETFGSGKKVELNVGDEFDMKAWEYRVFYQ
ncbi:Alpha-amylase 2 [Thalassocella blandensis]|nr:Alpha-amylase 2 [Thalassocella blandensis]